MSRASQGRLQRIGLCSAVLALHGCIAPSSVYTAPRATPVGRFTAVLATQAMRPSASYTESGSATPGLVVGLRAGLAKQLDIGARTTLRAAAADLKWNVLQSELVDLTLDAGAEGMPETFYVHAPVLLGLNVGDNVTLLPNSGVTFGWGDQPNFDFGFDSSGDPGSYGFATPQQPDAGSVFVRFGFGAQLRFSPTFAVQPEVLLLRLAKRPTPTSDILTFGVGMIWGAQSY